MREPGIEVACKWSSADQESLGGYLKPQGCGLRSAERAASFLCRAENGINGPLWGRRISVGMPLVTRGPLAGLEPV